jgi:uncharacterized surface protein with fasciclin (FAS1) repeats
MKKSIKNLGMAIILSAAVVGVNASELKSVGLKNLADPVLKMESWMTDFTLAGTKSVDSGELTVVEIAVENSDFSTLVEAVSKANLVDALSADGPFTVFAPTNEAFDKLFKELGVSGIKDLSAEQLTPILTYHVVSGNIKSGDLSNTSVATLNGRKLKLIYRMEFISIRVK